MERECSHWWKIGKAYAGVCPARCKHCGASRTFKASADYDNYDYHTAVLNAPVKLGPATMRVAYAE